MCRLSFFLADFSLYTFVLARAYEPAKERVTSAYGCHRNTNLFRKNFNIILWKVLNIYVTKYTNVTSRRQGKCTRKYVTICILMALELHAPSPPSAAHKLLVLVVGSAQLGCRGALIIEIKCPPARKT